MALVCCNRPGSDLDPRWVRGYTRHQRTHTPLNEIWDTVFYRHGARSCLGLALMIAQAFFFNAIFFTYSLVLVRFYKVAPEATALYLIPFAFGNVLGPLLLGPLFDNVDDRSRHRRIATRGESRAPDSGDIATPLSASEK